MRQFLVFLTVLSISACAHLPTVGGVLRHNNMYSRWYPEDFPLNVVISPSLNTQTQEILLDCMNIWNAMIGTEVFVPTEVVGINDPEWWSRRDRTIYIHVDDLSDEGWLGVTNSTINSGHFENALIQLDSHVNDDTDIYLVLLHELGHSLGLAHDDYRPSIMYEFAASSGGRILPVDRYWVIYQMTESP
jgi:hypothetical protein